MAMIPLGVNATTAAPVIAFLAPRYSAFSGYRWPPDVILMAVRWYCSLPLSAAQVVRLLAECHIDVTARTVLNWVQTFGDLSQS